MEKPRISDQKSRVFRSKVPFVRKFLDANANLLVSTEVKQSQKEAVSACKDSSAILPLSHVEPQKRVSPPNPHQPRYNRSPKSISSRNHSTAYETSRNNWRNNVFDISMYFQPRTHPNRECAYCKFPGHIKQTCIKSDYYQGPPPQLKRKFAHLARHRYDEDSDEDVLGNAIRRVEEKSHRG